MSERPDELIGQFVGNYRLVEMIGEGGMARVYRAVHPEIAREVAVKVMSAELARKEEPIRRFKVEAQAVNRIRHPNIVEIFDFGTLPDGRSFYVMELLAGESLATHIRRVGAMTVAETIAVIEPMLDALEAAHRAQILHRDLKPDNVFLKDVAPGRVEVKLLDFGIAKLLDAEDSQQTRTGTLMGTPAYMAPEQCAGRTHEIGPHSDVYSVACMIFQMLAGDVPFTSTSLGGLLLEHLNSTPPTLAERAIPGVPAALSRLIARCLSKSPGERPATASELRAELRAAAADAATLPPAIATPAGGVAKTMAAGVAPPVAIAQGAALAARSAVPAPRAGGQIAATRVAEPAAASARRPTPAPLPAGTPLPSAPLAHTGEVAARPAERGPPRARGRRTAIAGAVVVVAAAIAILINVRADSPPSASPTAASAPGPAPAPAPAPDLSPPPSTPPTTPVPATVGEAQPDLVDRLAALRRLCDTGELSKGECKQRRKAIIKEFADAPRSKSPGAP